VVGIIVSIGVSIDSNIVYFEVIKDDMHTGRNLRSSAERAFRSAIRTIIRADAVSLIAAALLYWLTVGSVRGFAFYLGLATLLDLIAAYFFMRPAVLLLARTKMADDHPTWFGIPRPRVPPPPPPVGPPPGPSREPEVAVG
jgi:preprotein translocase subunit SecD